MLDLVSRTGDALVERGLLTRQQAEQVAGQKAASGRRFLSEAVALGLVTEDDALGFLAQLCGVPAVDLRKETIPTDIAAKLPVDVARTDEVIAIKQEDENLVVAMAEPANEQLLDEIGFATGYLVVPHAALAFRIREAIDAAYEPGSGGYQGPLANEPAHVVKPTSAEEFEINVEGLGNEDDTSWIDPPTTIERPAGSKTILVVDDEVDIQNLVRDALTPLGAEILTAGRGIEALKKIKKHSPDLLVLDAMLPEVHGFEICKKVKQSKRFGKVPVLMISAVYRGWRIAEDVKVTYKVDEFLEKPFRVSELRRKAAGLLAGPPPQNVDENMADDAKQAYEKGVEAYQNEKLDEALESFRAAEQLEPFSPNIEFMLGRVLERADRSYQAIYHYERAIELDSNFFSAIKNLALLYQNAGFKNKAVEMWERGLSAAPDDAVKEQIKNHLVSLL